jgi:O-antigen ligase
MSFPVKLIRFSFYALFLITPVIFLPSTSELFEFNKMVVVYLLTILIAAAWLIQMIFARRLIFTRTLLDWPLLIFLASQLLSLLFSVDPRTSLMGYYSRFNGGLLSLVCYSLLFWAFVTFMDKNSAKTAVSVSVWTAVLVCLYGILEHFGIDASLWIQDVQNRVFSTLGQPNWLAAYIISLLFLPLADLIRKPGFGRFLTPVILILTLLFTKSRSGFLAFGLSSAVFWLYLLLRRRTQSLKPFLAVLLLTVTLTLTISNPIRDLYISPVVTTPGKTAGPALEVGGTESGSIRKIVWTGAIRAWLSSPKTQLIGFGPETFTMAYYQFRPVEHNLTSEWELLYNKAHNEFLNYLTTTGIIGLGAYLLLLVFMLVFLLRNLQIMSTPQLPAKKSSPTISTLPLTGLALLAGWLTIPVTNFLGFSVVIVQVLLFLLPALSFTLNRDTPSYVAPSASPVSPLRILLLLTVISAGGFLLLSAFRYWLADVKYASGNSDLKAFRVTENPSYILSGYESLRQAFDLNPADPVIASEFSLANAYTAILASESDPAASAKLIATALTLSDRAVAQSPHHPNYYKSASRTALLISAVEPDKIQLAVSALEHARQISPTDPLIPYNLGLIYTYSGQSAAAAAQFGLALELKPDYADAREKLSDLASPSASPAP